MNVRNLEKIQDKWLLFQRFVTSIVVVDYHKNYVGLVLIYSNHSQLYRDNPSKTDDRIVFVELSI